MEKKDLRPSWEESLTRLTNDLKNKDAEPAATNLRHYVATQARELSNENFAKMMTDLTNNHICVLMKSPAAHDKVAAVMAIDCLIDIEHEENEKTTKLSNYLRLGLQSNEPAVIVPASKALGRLASQSITVNAEMVEFESRRAFEWLHEEGKHTARQYAATLVLKELAENAPALFVGQGHIPTFFEVIWHAVRDNSDRTREAAIEALRAVLVLLATRENRVRLQWYHKIIEEADKGLKMNSIAAIHGSLLALGELIGGSGKLLLGRYNELCDSIIRFKEHRDKSIVNTVTVLLPRLAAFSPTDFVNNYLNTCITFLFVILKDKSKNKGAALLSIGHIAKEIGPRINPYLDYIVQYLRVILNPRNKHFCLEAITCVGLVASAAGNPMEAYLHDLLALMFATGLNAPLTEALLIITGAFPSLLYNIQEKMLDQISIALTGKPFIHPNSAKLREAGIPHPQPSSTMQFSPEKDKTAIQFALTTLGTFNLPDNLLLDFLRNVVVNFLDDVHPGVRKAAVMTSTSLLMRINNNLPTKGYMAGIIGEILEKLLIVGITDPDPSIRKTVLSCLEPSLDHHLAQVENLRSLCIALNDSVVEIRLLAIPIIGRLAFRNPAYVMPALRKVLHQLLMELEFSDDISRKEESARLLCRLISSAHQLIKPYVEPIIDALLPKIKDAHPHLASCLLATLGELAAVGEKDMIPYIHDLMPPIISTLQDRSSVTKREVALNTLTRLCESTGYVIDPLLRYPSLLGILLEEVKTERHPSARREVVKALGTLGALDPYRHSINAPKNTHSPTDISSNPSIAHMTPSAEDYYIKIAVHCLIGILRDPSCSSYHPTTIQSLVYIFKSFGVKCSHFLPDLIPLYLQVMKSKPEMDFLKFTLRQLREIVAVIKQYIRDYLDDIFEFIKDYWQSPLVDNIIGLIEEISLALNNEFKVYLPNLIPQMLRVLRIDNTKDKSTTKKILHVFEVFGSNLDDFFHLVIPAIVNLFNDIEVRVEGVQALGRLCMRLTFFDYSSRIIHPLAKALEMPDATWRKQVMDTLCVLVYRLASDYAIFIPMLNKILVSYRIEHANYDALIARLLSNQPLLLSDTDLAEMKLLPANYSSGNDSPPIISSGLGMNKLSLKRAFQVTHNATKEDWENWMRRVSITLLTCSPSPALRACLAVAQMEPSLARTLFNSSFVSCWDEIQEQHQQHIAHSIEVAFKTQESVPTDILEALLNLAEFMEHADKPFPLHFKVLGRVAESCAAYAKALHYTELEFRSLPNPNLCESLISLNNQLDLPEAAMGIMLYSQQNEFALEDSWYEKLKQWDQALEIYTQKQKEALDDLNITMGRLRCLHALSEWEGLSVLSEGTWAQADKSIKKKIAPLASAAAWNLRDWDTMPDYVAAIPDDTLEGSFFRAIMHIHAANYDAAQNHIEQTRVLLDGDLRGLVGESYNRAYKVVVKLQQLTELEEVIDYKRSPESSERRSVITSMWSKRLQGCQRNVEIWQDLMAIRSIAISPAEDSQNWLKFASLCRKTGKRALSQKILSQVLESSNNSPSSVPHHHQRIQLAYLKGSWHAGNQRNAFEHLRELTDSIHDDDALLARCHHTLGLWKEEFDEGRMSKRAIKDILKSYKEATEYDSTWFKGWHSWALANFEAVSHYQRQRKTRGLSSRIVAAVHGFFQAIALAPKARILQDLLRLLSLWFDHGEDPEVEKVFTHGLTTIPVTTWLQVIPQLIARIDEPKAIVAQVIHELLSIVGREHPQALVFPLSVPSKSESSKRSAAANSILLGMKRHSEQLVDEALLVSKELIRVAILWTEMWLSGLEQAAELFFGANKNFRAMLEKLEPLHAMIEEGAKTQYEISFMQAYGNDLHQAREWCNHYRESSHVMDLNQAWVSYLKVYHSLKATITHQKTFDLQYASPQLLAVKDLELAVPGTYEADGAEIVKIHSFASMLTVIGSKQRPKKLSIFGSDGKEYPFLLKGHEDLKQDERMMQLFGLVNALLSKDSETADKHLSITRYAIIPLSPTSGLIGWVPDHDTLHDLIAEHRRLARISLSLEKDRMCPLGVDRWNSLTLIQKLESFEYALEGSLGNDLERMLWLKSPNSEVWLDRRTNYTRSLAVMSMVGYVLGLGDRHPSNLMLDRVSGRITHIDFGDCFEVTKQRTSYPEMVPFRLTRMLINAMEVSGIEGNFRSTCESVMRVLRENRESVMAALEAFVYDPLITWRLLQPNSPDQSEDDSTSLSSPLSEEFLNSLQEEGAIEQFFKKSYEDMETRLSQSCRRPCMGEIWEEDGTPAERRSELNAKALEVIERVTAKLRGRDFAPDEVLTVPEQVQRLIAQATSHENLCRLFPGWCPFW